MDISTIANIASRFQENCYDGISLARQLLEPHGYERSDFMRNIAPKNFVMRITIFENKEASSWLVLNYSDDRNEVVAFGDEKSYRSYLSRQRGNYVES